MFGTDGVRGVANSPELSAELALQLGRAAVFALSATHETPRPLVIVGQDPRQSGDMLAAALVAGLLSAGADVVRLGVATTPAVAFAVPRLGAIAGAMISASHNPAPDNGIKFFDAKGYKLTDAMETEIEALLRDGHDKPLPVGSGIGRVRTEPELLQQYIDYVTATVPPLRQRRRIVVDCANGAASVLAPAVYRALGLDVVAINATPDGVNINAGCGSTHPAALQAAVAEHRAALGIAHDGDADRVIFVDEHGHVVDGDGILYIVGCFLQGQERLPGNTVVATVMSNLGLERGLQAVGVSLRRTAVGDRYVMADMLRGGFMLGGEQSGHVIFREHSTTGDGILTAVQVLSVLDQSGGSLAELVGRMPRFPQHLINVTVADRSAFADNEQIAAAIAAAEARLQASGRVLVRPSGTEPIVRVMVEATEAALCEQVATELAAVVAAELGAP